MKTRKMNSKIAKVGPNTFYCPICADLVDFYPFLIILPPVLKMSELDNCCKCKHFHRSKNLPPPLPPINVLTGAICVNFYFSGNLEFSYYILSPRFLSQGGANLWDMAIDDYAKDGGPGEVGLTCSFYHDPLRP